MKVVYVVVSNDADVYLEQAYVSMCSLKYHMPHAQIVMLTDDLTDATFKGVRKEETKYADEIVVVELPKELNAQRRSRILKTTARKHVKGDFLFVDCDTIVAKPLDEICAVQADIAIVSDLHAEDFKDNPYYLGNVSLCKRFTDFPIETEAHFYNTGVIFVKDTDKAHEFYEEWNRLLCAGWDNGIEMDQPSFAYTNYRMGYIAQTLDGVWNCQLCYGFRYLKDAKIVHYICTNGNRSKNKEHSLYLMNELSVFDRIKKYGEIPQEVESLMHDPFKGLSPVSLCIAGEDLLFFHTAVFANTRLLFGTKAFAVLDFFLRAALFIPKRINRLTKKIQRTTITQHTAHSTQHTASLLFARKTPRWCKRFALWHKRALCARGGLGGVA